MQENLLLFFLTDLLPRPSALTAGPQGRCRRGLAAALPLRGLKDPAVDRAALKEKDRVPPVHRERRQPARRAVAEDSKG